MRRLGLALACLSTSVLLHGASGAQEGGLLGLYALPECPAGANCGISDYKDKTYACDETTTPLKPGQADIVEFRCLDGRCMSIEGLRNGYKNCEDGSDEGVPEALAASAPTPPPPTPAPTTPAPATTTEATTTTEETTTTLPETHTTTSTTLAPTTTTTAAPTTTPTTPPPPPPPPPSPMQPLPPPPTLAATTTATATATATTTATTTMTAPLGPAIRTVQMTDPSSGSVWYTGPVDEDGRAHGTGKFDYSDGNKFVGIFDHGVMQAGVLYSSKADEQEEERRSSSRRGREQQKESLQARLTMRSGGWTTPSAATLGTAVDPAIVRAFPLEQAFNGPLRVTIKSASNLDNTDWLDKDDPFAKAEFSGDLDGAARLQFTTPQVQNTLNPVWDYSFELPHVEIGDKMWLKVKDRDSWGSDDGLGSTTLFFTKVPKQETLPLKGHESGMLEVSVVAASDAEVEAPIGVDCGQYVVGSQEASTDFLARGSLRSGIQYSASKSFSDKVQAASALAAWGTVVNGVEAGGNWVQVCRPATADGTAQQQPWYLPKVGPNGETLLVPFLAQASIDLDEEQDEDDGGLPKAIEGPEKPMDTTTTHTTTPSTAPSTTASTKIVTAPQTTAAKTKTSAEATTAERKRERKGYNLNFHGWGSDTHADTVILTTTTTQEATTTTSTELLMMPFQETSTTETTTQKRTPGTAVPVTTQAPSTTTTKQLKTFNPPELNKLKSESDDDLGGGDEDSDHAEVGVHVEDKVIVLSSFSGNRSCSSRMSKQALSHRDVRQMCRDASVEIASGTSGVVLATGPRNSVVIRFASNPLPQLVMEEQLTVLAIECVHNYCSQGAVVVTSTFSTDQGVQLLEGQTATVLQSSTKSLVISVPTVEHTQTVAASKFSHISCRQDEHSCSGSALVVTKDFTLDSGLELIKGQWGTFLRMDSKSNAVINFSSGLKEQLVPKHYLRFLGCLAEAVAPEPPKLEPNVFPAPRWITGSMGSLKPRRGSGRRLNEELAEVQDRELRLRSRGKGHNASDKSSIASHFRRQSAPRARAWRAPAQSADPCVPQELTRYPSTSLAVAFSVVIEHLSVKQSDKRQLQADIEMKLKNTSGLSEVKLELRYGGDSEASVALGFITPAKDDDDADVFQSCDKLRKNAQAVLLEAISKRMPNQTASGLRVEGGYFSTQHSWLTHRPDPEAVHTSLCFSAELVDFEKARLKREKEIQQAFFKGILLATGRSMVASNLKVVWHLPPSDQTTSQGRRLASDNDKVTADVCIAVSRMDKANKLWHYLLASGAQYLQVVLQPLIGLGTQVFLGAFVVTYQAMPPATDSWDTNVIEKSGLILALNGLTTWRVIVISDTDTFDRLQAQNQAIKNKTETTKKALQIQQEEDELTWEQRRAICLWEKHFDEWYKEQPLQIAPYPVVDYPPQPGLPEIPELLPEDAVPWPPFPSNPPWPLLVENYPEVVDEREEARLAQAAHNHNHATAANTLQEARASWQRQPIDIFNLTETLGCSARDVTYEPLDMTGAGPTKEVTIAACQARCSLTSGCARFAYWLAGGICHLQNAFAYRTGARFGFISGPSGCRLNQQSLEIIQIQLKKRTCFDIDTSRTPLDMTGTTPRRADNILECQDRCQGTLGCWYFTFNSLSNMCHLSDYHAQPVAHMEYHVAGPSECQPPAQFSFRIVNLPYDCVADKVWLMTKLELAIRKAVACEAGYNVTMNSVGAVLRPLRLTRTAGSSMPARAASSRTSVQVVIWPPNHMTFEELDAQMNDTAKLTMALNAAIRFVPGIKCCKRGFVILVEDVTPLKSMQDVTASRNQARNRAVAAGEAAKEATIRQKEAKEQQMDPGHIAAKDARKEAAILEMVDAKQEKRDREIEVARQKAARNAAMKEAMQQSPCQSGHCLPGVVNGAGPGTLQREEEKRGDFFRRTSMPVGGAVFVMSLLACAVVAFVGASGGMAVSRSMARRQRQRRLEQAGLIEASGDRFSSLLRTERLETNEAMAGIEEYSDSDDDNFAEDATARQALVSSHSRGFSAARRTQPSNASGFRLHLPMPSGDTEDPPAWPPEMRAQLAGIGSLLSCAVGSPQTERGLAREVTSLPSSAAAPFMLDADFDLSRLGGDADPLSD